MKRRYLFQEIIDAMREWPTRDQQIFIQAHYHGQSIEMISASLNMDVKQARMVLQRCNRALYAKLRKFREDRYGESPLAMPEAAGSITCKSAGGGCNF